MGNKQPKESNQQTGEESVDMNGDPEKGVYETSPMNEKAQMEEEQQAKEDSKRVGLSSAELMKEGNTPFWKGFRVFLLIVMWVSWILMAVAAVVILVKAPRCPNLQWWDKNAVYQVYCRSFQDSDGDGVGDIKGLESRLDHLEDIHAKTLLLSNIFQSDGEELLFATTDFKEIDEQLGTLEDFKSLLAEAASKDVKVVLDFIPNHSSEEHPWFIQSRTSKGNNCSDYYIWADGKDGGYPPNNWLNVYGDPAWTYEPQRDQWYYHTYTNKQPDLNFRNETVKEEIKAVLQYWLKVGVDGYMIRDASYLFEAEDLMDEPTDPEYDGASDEYNKLLHSKTMNQAESYDLVGGWKRVIKSHDAVGKTRTMFVEPRGPLLDTMGYYGADAKSGADVLYNHQLLEQLEGDLSGNNIHALVEEWSRVKDNVTGIAVQRYSWVLGDVNYERVASRYGKQYVRALNALIFTLPGVPITYYGEDIGMESLPDDQVSDVDDPAQPIGNNTVPVKNHAAQISPMQWNAAENAGFSNGSVSWIPVHENHGAINVEAQKDNDTSTMTAYRQLAVLRQEPSLVAGKLHSVVSTEEIYAFTRRFPEWPAYFVAINVGDQALTENYRELSPGLPQKGSVAFSTHGNNVGGAVMFDSLTVDAGEAIVVQY